jgi:phage portal protein BeeE
MTNTGASKAGSVIILPEAMDLKEVRPSVVDADFESARRFSIDDVARLTGVPASLLANRHDVKYSTLSDEYASYVSSALDQYAAKISAEYDRENKYPGTGGECRNPDRERCQETAAHEPATRWG